MQALRRCFLQVGVLVFVTGALALSVQGASFSEESLRGSYSYMLNKWTVDVGKNQYAEVGVMTFDGAGNMTGSYNAVGGGVLESAAISGTYTVNSDGTGVLEVTSVLYKPPTIQLGFVLNSAASGQAHGFQFMETDNANNVVISGTALLQYPTAMNFNLASLEGSFSFQYNTWSVDPDMAQDGGVGVLAFDGKGNLKGSWIDVYGGQSSAQTATGTYTVNADGICSATLLLKASTSMLVGALNSAGALGATGLQLVLANPGPRGTDDTTNYAITVTAVKQSTP